MNDAFTIRRLGQGDVSPYREIRLEALERHPEAFGASFEDEAAQPVAAYERRLATSEVFGGLISGTLMGIVRFSIEPGAKRRHIGVLTGMYVRQSARGGGLASALVQRIIDTAHGRVGRVNLTVTALNEPALRLYQRHGFRIYGTEPDALMVGGRSYDEHLMTREIEARR